MRKITKAFDVRARSRFRSILRTINRLLGLMLCITGISLTGAASSNLDPGFGVLGKVINSPDGSDGTSGNVMALAPDGKIVMLGNKVVNNAYAGIMVARYNADGSLDTTFDGDGWNTATFGMQYEFGAALDIQPDGKIVVGVSIRNVINNIPRNEFGIVRFNADGSLDPTFDGDGQTNVNFDNVIGGFYQEYVRTLKIGSDGKIVIAGTALDGGVGNQFVFARLNADGSLDTTFGTGGKLGDGMLGGSNNHSLNGLTILPDGKIVYVAKIYSLAICHRRAVKLNVNGAREWEYSQGAYGGRFMAPDSDALYGITQLANGKLIVAGKRDSKVAVLRLNADGTEDNTFINAPGMPNGDALNVAIQTDGKIVARVSSTKFSLVRFNADGSLDTTFGVGGFVSTSVSSGQDYGTDVLVQTDGKILVGGSSQFGSPTKYFFTLVRYIGTSAVPRKTLFDYDGDGKSDISVFRPAENRWYILQSSNSALVQFFFGAAGDVLAPSDYDGDGKTDLAIFRPSAGDWWYRSSITGTQVNVHFGQAGDIPRPADFDGDGKTDFVVYRPSNNVWYRLGTTGATSITQFGIAEDKPLVGDFDGDGKGDLAVFRPSTGDWWFTASASGGQFSVVHWGQSGDIPAPGDYDADGKTDFVVFRPSSGGWYILRTGEQNYTILSFGLADDKPVAGDYDGDGKADVAVWRPSSGVWYLLQTTVGFGAVQLGAATDTPTESAFVP